MTNGKDRREFLKGAALVSIAGAAAGTDVLADIKTVKLNTEAKALMPDGKVRTRVELMQELGLGPSIGTDAWLNIIGCLLNAGALTDRQRAVLTARGFKFQGVEAVAVGKMR